MSDNRIEFAKKNIRTSIICQVITVLCGIIVPRYMLIAFGSEVYGATASITQFLAYITLIEGGIGGVARAALYEPLAQKDTETISLIFNEVKRFFFIVGIIFIVYASVIAVTYKSISNIECIDWLTSCILVLVISISTCGQHFIGISNAILLQAAQRVYVTNVVSVISILINTIFVIVLIRMGCGIIVVKLVSSCIFVVKPIVLCIYVRKTFGLQKQKNNVKYLSNKWSGLGQHIAFFLHSNVDIVILTLIGNLKLVAVYSLYSMVISNMQSIIVAFSSGMEALFGDMLAKREHKMLNKTFSMYEMYISNITIVLLSTTLVLIVPFIELYTTGIDDVNYTEPLFAVFFVLATMIYCTRQPYHASVMAAGRFKETNVAAYGEVIINLLLSIILVSRWGLVGVAVGTFIAVFFRYIYYVVYVSKNIIYRDIKASVKQVGINIVILVITCAGGKLWSSANVIENYTDWAISGVVVMIIAIGCTVIVNLCVYRKAYIEFLHKMLRVKKNV